MCILASITAALLCWPLLAVLALRRTDRLASHPVLSAKTSHLFLDEYLVCLALNTGYPDSTHFCHSVRQVFGMTPTLLFKSGHRLRMYRTGALPPHAA